MESYGRTAAYQRLCLGLAALLSLCALDCVESAADDDPRGTSLGTFHATALLTSSNCGAGVEAPASHEFDVVLSQDDTAIYWTQSGTTLIGSLDDDEATWTYQAPAQMDGPCTIAQQEELEAKLDDIDQPKMLKGTIRQGVTPVTGTTCSRQVTAAGGTFDNLPCSVGYVFSAKRK
jgi:hypothetical protein